MIDTIGFHIPLSSENIQRVQNKLDTHQVIECETGVIKSEIFRGSLVGSYDNRISVQIRDFDFKNHEQDIINHKHYNSEKKETTVFVTTKRVPQRIKIDPYIRVEFSLAKWMYGVNFVDTDLETDYFALHCFRIWIEKEFEIETPFFDEWKIYRIDIAENLNFHTLEFCKYYIEQFRYLDYPRRKRPMVTDSSVYYVGSTTTNKIYIKELEWKRHDKPKFRSILSDGRENYVQDLTKGCLRFEVEFHKRKLKTMNCETLNEIFLIDWEEKMKAEIIKIVGKSTKINRHKEVVETLNNVDLSKFRISATAAQAVWTTIVMHGQNYARQMYGRQKVWRAKKVFEQYGISMLGGIKENEALFDEQEIIEKQEGRIIDFTKFNSMNVKKKYADILGKSFDLNWWAKVA